MNDRRHRRLEELFHDGLAVAPERRRAWLAEHCPDDEELRSELEILLELDSRPDSRSLGTAVSFRLEPLPERVGSYRLGEKLGEGGFGEVYAAEQESPVRRPVAIKILKPGMDSRAVLARFEAERQTLALMDHPGIARVYDAGATPGGRPYFVMELVEGEAITVFADRHGLSLRSRVELMVAVCRAVAHAHQKGVIHRDLKPSNILVTLTDGKPAPHIIDFGIAKATASAPAEATLQTGHGEFLGTPEYASPEQTRSAGTDIDTRTDVYALGAVLYRLLTGAPPFDSARLREAGLPEMARILRDEDPPRPSDRHAGAAQSGIRARDLRGDLDWITLRALERERERRYPSAAALGDDLERYLRDQPAQAGPPGAAYRIGKFVRRRRALVLGVVAVLLALIAGLIGTGAQALRARRAEAVARHRAEVAGAVSTFLTRMFAAADPERNPRGAEVTVREILDGAARELESSRSGPEVGSAMHQALGSTYMGLALYDQAAAQFERAAATRGPAGASASSEAIETALSRAELDVRRGQYARAESLLAELAGPVERNPGPGEAARVRLLRLRGDNLTNLGRNEEADSLLSAAAARARATLAPDSQALAGALHDLARIRGRRGRMQEADSIAREALAIARRAGGGHQVANLMGGLAEILRTEGRFGEADSLYVEAIAIERRVLGPRHPGLAYSLGNRALVLEELGRFEESERIQREAIDLLSAALGRDHPEVLVTIGNLATVLQDRGSFAEALGLRLRVLDGVRRARPSGHPDLPSALNNLGSLYRLMKRYPEAEAAFRQAITGFHTAFGGDHPLLAVAIHNLGKTQLDRGGYGEAEATLRQAIELGGRVFPPGHVNLAIFGANHARALAGLGRFAEAEREMRPARDRILESFGPAHPRAREIEADLARLTARLSARDGARP